MAVIPRFSAEEMARRLAGARSLMEERELDALVIHGAGTSNASLCWLSNHRDLHGAYLVVPRAGDPTLLVSFLNHLPNAQERSTVPTEWGGHRPGERVAELLRGAGARRVGLVGGRASYSYGMPYRHYLGLRDELPETELTDASGAFEALQIVKSDEEVEWLRRAAGLTDLALAAIAQEARPGMSEHELVARAEFAYRREGGEVGISFLRSMPMDDPSGFVPAQRPTDRQLAAGDVIIMELSATYGGYSGQVLWPVFVAVEPRGEWRQLFDAAHDAYRGMEAAVCDGATVGDAIAAAGPIGGAGYAICDSLLHGMGLGIHPPYAGPEDLENPPADGGMRFTRGMSVVLQPNPITRDERMGIQLGALTVVRDDRAECLHALPSEPLIAAAG